MINVPFHEFKNYLGTVQQILQSEKALIFFTFRGIRFTLLGEWRDLDGVADFVPRGLRHGYFRQNVARLPHCPLCDGPYDERIPCIGFHEGGMPRPNWLDEIKETLEKPMKEEYIRVLLRKILK